MGNSLRCCLACVLPCGALDLIRIVHLNGCVDEITHSITAGEILKANPNHILSKPSSQGVVRRILIISPETELKRGSIYFLIPETSLPENKRNGSIVSDSHINKKSSLSSKKRSTKCSDDGEGEDKNGHLQYKEKKSSRRDRKKGRVGIWRPHLASISED
ncbi:hypothetical protein L195_g052228 [Trifolium pratense]|uniref:Uncharacterized protein n=2 Tax=Trifolium pratense TaxID=57577 RepID=A0ACB0J5Z7_TRIPR|nr:uncharacterized protein LOC123916179 [Trifolium pratense]PNX61008.1 hypothetical protein L195_g052228 [Trifolium pratense]CAJ2640409.1 unnamed protein product [Trifolium pratense]